MTVKVWADGDYVQAADLNDMTVGGNLAFTNAAARDAFLVGPLAPVQGQMVHMLDDGLTYKRITVAGASYWAPPPGTLICAYSQTAQSSLPASSITVVTNLTTSAGRTSPWWASDKFTPLCPGFYQFDGQVAWSATASDAGRGSGIYLNGAFIPGSVGMYRPSIAASEIYPARTCVAWMNGSTDYAQLAAYNQSTTAHTTYVSAGIGSAISIKYLGT